MTESEEKAAFAQAMISANMNPLEAGQLVHPANFNRAAQIASMWHNDAEVKAMIAELKKAEIAISMDGKGAWRDNVFVERLWRTIKYEEVYLHAYGTVREARAAIGRYLSFYNGRRPHSSLDRKTPDQAYFNQPQPSQLAA